MRAEGSRNPASTRRGLRGYGWVGLAMLAAGLSVGIATSWWPLRVYLTPWMWSGYLLFVDAVVARLRGRSLLQPRPARFFFLLPVSLALWLVFEAYNLHLRNWAYIGLPADRVLTLLGYVWSFATIWPALFLTADLLEGLGLRLRGPRLPVGKTLLRTSFVLGLLAAVVPLLLPRHLAAYTFAAVWCAYVLLLEPVLFAHPSSASLLRDAARGDWTRWASLALGGLVCGFVWESWNMLATARWVYILPLFQGMKLFEMPLPGFLGFVPFAWEAWCMYWAVALLLRGGAEEGRVKRLDGFLLPVGGDQARDDVVAVG